MAETERPGDDEIALGLAVCAGDFLVGVTQVVDDAAARIEVALAAFILKVVDPKTLSFTDVPGNRQFSSVGDLANNDRVALILVDCAHRRRLKILGRLSVRATVGAGRPQREMTIRVEGFDWNCPQHIPLRFEADDVRRALDERNRRIAELEAELAERNFNREATRRAPWSPS